MLGATANDGGCRCFCCCPATASAPPALPSPVPSMSMGIDASLAALKLELGILPNTWRRARCSSRADPSSMACARTSQPWSCRPSAVCHTPSADATGWGAGGYLPLRAMRQAAASTATQQAA